MLTFVLDASAILRLADGDAGAGRMKEILLATFKGDCEIVVSAVNWGEVAYTLLRRPDSERSLQIAHAIFDQGVTAPAATVDRAERAGRIKLRYKLGYADAFAIELASDSPDHILVTADFDSKSAEDAIRIEFLPPKLQP